MLLRGVLFVSLIYRFSTPGQQSGKWKPTAEMSQPRADHGSTFWKDGRLLIAGGMVDIFIARRYCTRQCCPT